MANNKSQKNNTAKPKVNAVATPAKDANQAATIAETPLKTTPIEEKETTAPVTEAPPKETLKPTPKPVVKKPVTKVEAPEPPLVEAEEATAAKEPKVSAKSPTNKLGRLSPDKLVDFCGQLNDMYIVPDTPDAPIVLAQVRIFHSYLSFIVKSQIGDDLIEFPRMQIAATDLNILELAASALKTNIVSVLPATTTAGQTPQLEIQFNKDTVPEVVTSQVNKEKAIADMQIDLDPTKVWNAEELKQILIHLLVRNNSSSKNITETITWYRNHELAIAPEEAKGVIEATANVDWFNAILELLGEDIPMMLNGVLTAIWKRYCVSDTVVPIHFYVKKFAPLWSDVEIRDFVTFVCNFMSEKEPNVKKGEYMAFLAKPTPEYLKEIVDKAMKNTTPEMNALNMEYSKFIRIKRAINADRVGSAMQHVCNLYTDQADQAARLSLYKDLSEYSEEEEKVAPVQEVLVPNATTKATAEAEAEAIVPEDSQMAAEAIIEESNKKK